MPESYFDIEKEDQQAILSYAAKKLGRSENILEKDIWLCWVLKTLFEMPNSKPMAFKGGTSLSKVFNVINRFSEDVDITLDYRHFEDFNPFEPGISKTQTKKFSDRLKKHVQAYANDCIVPYLQNALNHLPNGHECEIRIDAIGEKIWISYPSVTEEHDQYLKEEVLLELGGRNVINPNETHTVKPYAAELFNELSFPQSSVVVLSPERTFWEKATLIHVECNRGLRENADRMSRHWYDLVKLYHHSIGKKAMLNKELLKEVVEHKTVFFNANYANYPACLSGEFCLLPQGQGLKTLAEDYKKMLDAEMLYGAIPTIEEVFADIKKISDKINALS